LNTSVLACGMRNIVAVFVLFIFCAAGVLAQSSPFAADPVSDHMWSTLLNGFSGVTTGPAHPSNAERDAIHRFVRHQFKLYPDDFEIGPAGDHACTDSDPTSWDCLFVQRLPVGRPGIYYVTNQAGERNPNGYIVQIKGTVAVDFVGGKVAGSPEVLKRTHQGLHDIVFVYGMGAERAGIDYLQFNGTRYRTVASHNFTKCGGLPDYEKNDQRWCIYDVRPVEDK